MVREKVVRKPDVVSGEDTFAEKLSLLFETRLSPDLDSFTLVEVSEGTGGNISPTYLMNLRDGKFSNPSMNKIKALSKFFDVPITYFYDESGARKLKTELRKEFEETINSLSSAQVRKEVAAKADPRAQAMVIGIVKKYQGREKQRQLFEGTPRKAEEERERLKDEVQQKTKAEEQKPLAGELQKAEAEQRRIAEQRKVQEEQHRQAEKEERERAEKEERGRLEAERQQREKELRKAEQFRRAEEAREATEEESQQKKEEALGGRRRPPLKRGGRPRGSAGRPAVEQTSEPKPSPLKPEIVCWNEGWRWILGIELPEELENINIVQNEEPLEQDNTDELRYRVKHAGDVVKITWTEGEKVIPLIEEGRNYLVFKMRRDWKGLGRFVRHPTAGYYLAVVPQEWKRDEEVSDSAPVAPESVQLDGYKAHFFYQEQDRNTVISFVKANGERIQVESGRPRFQLTGRGTSDASEEMGPLFCEQPPHIRTISEDRWEDVGAIVVGQEGSGRNRWRVHFVPQVGAEEQPLPEEIRTRRGGWYFVRIYDTDDNLLESMDFRFMMALKDIVVESSNCLPGPKGYDNATVRFLHQTDCKVELTDEDAQHALDIRRESGLTIVTIPPKADCDNTRWILRERGAEVEVTVLVERTWWAFGVMKMTPTDWADRPIAVSHNDFSAITDKALWVRLPRKRFVREVDVGLDRTKSRSYQVEVRKKEVAIPLRDFCDAEEIQNQKQECLFQLFIDSQDKTYSTPLLRIRISFRCKNCQFITRSEQEALSHMAVHLSDIIPHLSYDELYQRSGGSLPYEIYACGYCDFYVAADDPMNPTSTICSHIEHDCRKVIREGGVVKITFRAISDVDEIRENVIAHLPHIYRCQICNEEFEGDDRELRLAHLQENHKNKLFKIF